MDVLTSAEVRALRKLACEGRLPLHCDLEPVLKGLDPYAMIYHSDSDKEGNPLPDCWVITRDGRRYIDQDRRSRRQFWLSFILSILALLISAAALLADLLPSRTVSLECKGPVPCHTACVLPSQATSPAIRYPAGCASCPADP